MTKQEKATYKKYLDEAFNDNGNTTKVVIEVIKTLIMLDLIEATDDQV